MFRFFSHFVSTIHFLKSMPSRSGALWEKVFPIPSSAKLNNVGKTLMKRNNDKFIEDNIANKTEIIFGLRNKGKVEVISGLVEGDLIVAEGLKKVRPRGKIKPIKN